MSTNAEYCTLISVTKPLLIHPGVELIYRPWFFKETALEIVNFYVNYYM